MTRRATDYEHLLRDNYETPLYAPNLGGNEFQLHQLEMMLKLSVDDFKAYALTPLQSGRTIRLYCAPPNAAAWRPACCGSPCTTSTSHMPARTRYMWKAFAARTGCAAEMWKAIQGEPEYAGNTTLFILPDFGRDSDEDPGWQRFFNIIEPEDALFAHNMG